VTIEIRPSNAHRWLVCHGQPSATRSLGDSSSKYADRGTVAHALLELTFRLDLQEADLAGYEGKTLNGMPPIPVDELMIRGIGHAVDYVRSYKTRYPASDYHIERVINIDLGSVATSGTADIVIDNLPHEMVIVDYKNGVVHVDHEENPQLQLYALGYVQESEDRVMSKTRIKTVIIQPNSRGAGLPVREDTTTRKELEKFNALARAAVKEIYGPDPQRVAGEHCRFCRAAGQCVTYADFVLAQAGLEFSKVEDDAPIPDPRDMQPADMARVLRSIDRLRAWLVSVEELAIQRMLDGQAVPGYKVVQSQPRRRWDDEAGVLAIVRRLGLPEDLVAPRSVLTPAQLEKLARGKAPKLRPVQWASFVRHITHNPIEPRVAPEDDRRALYRPGTEFTDAADSA
jgi:hypothetical protein